MTSPIADLILVQDRVVPTVERLMREHDPDVVGLSVMTFQRRTALRLIRLIRAIKPSVIVVAGGYDPSLAPEAYERAVERRRLRRPRRRGADVPRAAAGARAQRRRRRAHPGTHVPATRASPAGRVHAHAGAAGQPARRRRLELPDRGARVLAGYTFLGRPDRHRRNVARLHLRLQLLLDHRDARPQLPHLRLHARPGGHRRRPRPRRARDLPGRRQHHARTSRASRRCAAAIVDAGLNDIHYIVQAMTSSIASHGDGAGAADAQGGVSLRLPRHRERPRRRSRVPARVGEERAARRRAAGRQRDASRRSTRCTRPASRSSAASSSAIRTTRARRSRRTWRSRDGTSTGPTSSTRRRIRARR